MALSPLSVQSPLVSLIGGRELSRASGEGIPSFDFSGLNKIAAALTAKADRNKALIDQLAGKEQAGREGVVYDEAGNPVVPEVDQSRSPEYNAARINTRFENTRSKIDADFTTKIDLIETNPALSLQDKILQAQAIASGTVEALPPAFRSEALQRANALLEQRFTGWRRQEADRLEGITLDGLKSRAVEAGDAAISASASGEDYSDPLLKVFGVYDELVTLGKISEEKAEDEKQKAARLVTAAGNQQRIANGIKEGGVDLTEMDLFIDALKAGGDAELHVMTGGREGAPRNVVYSANDLREQLNDPATTEIVADRLNELLNRWEVRIAKREKTTEVFDHINGLNRWQRLGSQFEGEVDKIVDQGISLGVHSTDDGLANMVNLTVHSKYMAKPLVNIMTNTLLSADYTDAVRMVRAWQQIGSARLGGSDVGQMVRNNMSPADAAFLDAAAAAADRIGASGETVEKQMDLWRRYQDKAKDPENTVVKTIKRFNDGLEKTDLSYEKASIAKFRELYPGISMPAWMQREVDLTFHIESTMSMEPDQAKVFQSVWDKVVARHPPSKLYQGGVQVGPDLGDFEGVDAPTSSLPYGASGEVASQAANRGGFHWLNGYMREQFDGLFDSGTLDLDPADEAIIQRIMIGGPGNEVGEAYTLEDTGTNTQMPQFYVILENGNRLRVKTPEGRTEPLLLDPGIVKAHFQSIAAAEKDIQTQKELGERVVQDKVVEQWELQKLMSGSAVGTAIDKMLYGVPNEKLDPTRFYEWLEEQPEEFQDELLQDKNEAEQAMKDLIANKSKKITEVPKGTDLGPLNLFTPKVAGTDVSIAAVEAIEQILPDGTGGQFMLNLISVESDYGQAPETFRDTTTGDKGLTQINAGPDGAFREVQRRAGIPGNSIAIAAEKLKTLGIDVARLTVEDLDKPIVAVAIARLYMMTDTRPIPQDVDGQAEIWKSTYNTWQGKGKQQDFRDKANRYMMPDPSERTPYRGMKLEERGVGIITDTSGNEDPPQFLGTNASTQMAARRLSAVFGRPLRITPHGGKSSRVSDASQHPKGRAIDILVSDYTDYEKTQLIATAIALGYRGIGGYSDTNASGAGTIHLDLRPGDGNGRGGLATWWHTKNQKLGEADAEKWYQDGITLGLKMRDQNAT